MGFVIGIVIVIAAIYFGYLLDKVGAWFEGVAKNGIIIDLDEMP